MVVNLNVNGQDVQWDVQPGQTLLEILRREGLFSVKSGGCLKGECGACTVLLDGEPVNSCQLLAAQADGHRVKTVESVGEHPDQGWRKTDGLHIIQQALIQTGAIQCGYCTPAMALAALALLEKEADPSEEEVREALSGVLCRCTGYVKPVQAVLQAAAVLRGETNLDAENGMSIPVDLSGDMPPGAELDSDIDNPRKHTHKCDAQNVGCARKRRKNTGRETHAKGGRDQTGSGETCFCRRY